jgi:hypothetical protein
MPTLIELIMNNTDIKRLPKFENLCILEAKNSTLTEIPFLRNLADLNISGCVNIQNLNPLDMPSLECLNLGFTNIKEIGEHLNLTNLKMEKGILESIPFLRSLEYLEITDNKTISHIQNLPFLADITLKNTNVRVIKTTNLLNLHCENCRLLTEIPIVREIYLRACSWLFINENRKSSLIFLQRKVKKYLKERKKTVYLVLNRHLPYELSNLITTF